MRQHPRVWPKEMWLPGRSLVGACLVKSFYNIATWTRTARLIAEHYALQTALGGAPSEWACYRFTFKLREHSEALAGCLDRVTASLREQLPEYGRNVAIDASDLPAYANGQRYLSKNGPERERYSDPDASWGHARPSRRARAAASTATRFMPRCARTPIFRSHGKFARARTHESPVAASVLESLRARGFAPETAVLDKGYDVGPVYEACGANGCAPVIPLRKVRTNTPPGSPTCKDGTWTFAGADFKRQASKWRCPTGECSPASKWIRADRRNPLIPRETKRWGDLYRGRGAVEREFGGLKHEYGLGPLGVRGLERVALHADLCILARLSQALARARAVPLAA